MIEQKLIAESDTPEITKRIFNKSKICWYDFGCILQTDNRIHIRILNDYKKRWLNKTVLQDIKKVCLVLLKKYRSVIAICSKNQADIVRLIQSFGFNKKTTGMYKGYDYTIFELRGVNYV